MISQLFERSGETSGGVTVLLYDNDSDLISAYSMIQAILGGDNEQHPAIGEQATVTSLSQSAFGITIELVNLTFIRCNAVVQTQLLGTSYAGDVEAYGKRLDKRLASAVCN